MWQVFTTIANHLSTSFEVVVCMIVLGGTLIFFAANFLRGLIMFFLGGALLTAWFFSQTLNYTLPLLLMLMGLVVMALSLVMEYRLAKQGGLI